MIMTHSYRSLFICIVLCGLLLLSTPVIAEDSGIVRSTDPAVPQPGEVVNITLTVPPAFFGGIIEKLPDGFTFEGSSPPKEGIRNSGQTIIFALTGENTVQYTIRAPTSGCGEIQGRWENVGTKATGTIPATVIAVKGTDPSRCSTAPHTPGFSGPAALAACALIGLAVFRKVDR